MTADPEDIRNWLRLSPRVTTSGKLESADPARLAAVGVRKVINLGLADHPEALPDAGARMAEAGLDYVHIPVAFDAPQDSDYAAFVVALEADDRPVHVHCIMNFRVSAFFYRYHVEACGMDEAAARILLEKVWSPHRTDHGEEPPWRDFVERVGKQ
ncbi:protein tyrosine phosphatase family protein [Aurantiacibacter gilvus]|uniref:Protein tyrosine phosphatase family protein n=1 Tax=Aurantiacibacter gilvus TaxID=3139141 RepID=A0ABU9IJ14_9SPHN